MLNYGRQFPERFEPEEPTINWSDPEVKRAYCFALYFWGESLGPKGDPIGGDFSAYDIIGQQLEMRGVNSETATLIADMAYQDTLDLIDINKYRS